MYNTERRGRAATFAPFIDPSSVYRRCRRHYVDAFDRLRRASDRAPVSAVAALAGGIARAGPAAVPVTGVGIDRAVAAAAAAAPATSSGTVRTVVSVRRV